MNSLDAPAMNEWNRAVDREKRSWGERTCEECHGTYTAEMGTWKTKEQFEISKYCGDHCRGKASGRKGAAVKEARRREKNEAMDSCGDNGASPR